MLERINHCLCACLLLGAALCVVSCSDDEEDVERSLGFDEFVPKYNTYIKKWLSEEQSRLRKLVDETEKELATADAAGRADLEEKLAGAKRELGRIEFRQSLGDYFAFKKEEDIPKDLVWEDGMGEPEIGDPRAKKGGVLHTYMSQFPATVRPFGKEANNSFRGRLYDELEIALVGMHPLTKKLIPGLAKRWAVSKDGRTVYYELDPDAKYNDGVPVAVKDFMVGIYLRVSDNVSAPYQKQYFKEQFAQVATYGDSYISVSLPEPKPMMPLYGSLAPAAPHFYKDYGPDYVDRYQWKVAPHTGAYFVRDEDIVKGVSITLTRDKDWWAKDKKYYRYRFNPDKIVYTTIRDESKSFELFRAGQLDYFYLTRPNYWYEKSEIPPVFNGYIERYQFYTQYPRSPRGAYLNVHRPMLKNLDLRRGVCYALNWQKVIDVVFRGDFSRLQQFSEGFGEITNPHVKARKYSILKAREYFAKAGYTEEGPDGFLRKPNGERLAINMTYPNAAYYPKVVSVLKEEAKKAGMELRADGLEPTVAYKKVMKKEHDMTIWAWGTGLPFPSYYQFFFSKNAFDSEGNPKPQTNNINCYADPEMDRYCKGVRYARTVEEVKKNAWAAQQKIHDEAIFSPAWVSDFVRIGSWRWIRWPDTENTPFNVPMISDPMESYVLWIDGDMKEETLRAMRAHKKFPEVQKVIDKFKNGIPEVKSERVDAAVQEKGADDE